MADVGLVDVSLRDGNQSLWGAAGLRTAHVLQVAPLLERVGFRALDYTSSTAMGMLVRTHRENPWELFRRTRELMPRTKLQFIGTGFRFISWQNSHPDTMQLVYDRLVANGIDRVVVLDPMHDMDAARATAHRLKQAGVDEVVGALTFTISAVHDDAFYADLARQMRECPDMDRVYVKDPAGILSAERARSLLPAIRAQLGSMPLELHSHATIGLSPVTYSIAPELGVEVVQTGCGVLGYPIMVTPFPQMVVSQALFNVIGERYATVPDQVIRYALGSFGRPTAPLDPDVLDRILDRPRARELASEPEPPTPAELRRQFGTAISDEELLLRAHMPAEQVDAMLAAGPAPQHFNPALAPVLTLLRELGERRTVHDLAVAKADLRLFVHRRAEGAIRA
jgi:pyruvate/oxaloacetate carboxyltransferase